MGQFLGLLFLLVVGYFIVTGGYLIGTWIAVQGGAGNPSATRTTIGWIFEIVWIAGAIYLSVQWYQSHQREEEAKAKAKLEAEAAKAEQRERDRLAKEAEAEERRRAREAEAVEKRRLREEERQIELARRAAERAARKPKAPEKSIEIPWLKDDEDS